ncbi:DNA translocase FtsK 4TM domain-containing protein [Abyssibius alkaniclasticus]|uniref:DNA translocase FtsK 4TM domain-containing protein n=1 Tax=Abyssibius alkaniclasticus TaxID=2881234 RepID=UPI0040593B27
MAMAVSNARKPRRRRERLVESKTEAALRKRLAEFAGLCLLVLAFAIALALASYDASDPSFFVNTDAEAQNRLGLIGAYGADTLHRVLGLGAWSLVLLAAAWGMRILMHRASRKMLPRLIFIVPVVLLAPIYLATHVPPAGWQPVYSLGGMLGDSVLEWILPLIPLELGLAVKVASGSLALLLVGLFALAIGMTGAELRALLHIMKRGLIWLIAALMTALAFLAGRGAKAAHVGAKQAGVAAITAGRSGVAAAARARDARRERRALEPELSREGDGGRFGERLAGLRASEDDGSLAGRVAAAVRSDGQSPSRLRLGGVNRAGDVFDDDDVLDDTADAPAPSVVHKRVEPLVQHPSPKPAPQSARARAEAQPRLALEDSAAEQYDIPPLSLLENPKTIVRAQLSDDALQENARMLESVLDDYGVKGEIVSVRPGPVVTMYELEPAAGLKASRVIGLADDIARSMSALAARVSTIPGRSVIGIELPNAHREKVLLREILAARAYGDSTHQLPLALGKDIGGEPVVANLARMPHLLIAGTTGSGKSVAINTMILSLLYQLRPDECRLIMIDPKMLELSVYDGIPHLLSPVVTDPKKAVVALKWVVAEMEERYRKMSKMGVRNIDGYNGRVSEALDKGEAFTRTVQTGFDDTTGEPVFETEDFTPEKMPYIVVIVDEMADLMMVAGKEIEACIQRLAQMARASGIHLIMATQRPSVDVITGTIKANFPTRISFQVTSKIDSRTILGEMGAEQLLGMGDMLYMAGGGRITRVHGPFVSDEEVEEIVNFLKAQGSPEYVSGVVEGPDGDSENNIDLVLGLSDGSNSEDQLYDMAVAIVARDRKCSTSYIQRKLAIGYNKAARLVEQMEDSGIVSPANHVGKREILVPEG